MGYYVDLKTITLDKYKEVLKTADLIPSWKVLESDIDKNLDLLKQFNIENLDELLIALKGKEEILAISKQSGLSEKYLTVLKRVVKGYRQKPNKIKDFADLAESTVHSLEEKGIKNTLKLYPRVLTREKRKELSAETGISEADLLRLTKLTDLSRIRWVNHTFAYVLLESGYDTAEKVSQADYLEMYETVKQLNEERKIYNAHIGARDMRMCIESARGLDFEIEY